MGNDRLRTASPDEREIIWSKNSEIQLACQN